jgi:ATP-dependent Lhr-like helicase
MVQSRSRMKDGRWFLTTSLAVMGKPLDENRRAEMQARLLLQRYGILVKEWYRREKGLLPWYRLFQVLKRLEWQGEIRRGYFVNGLSGVQFALPEALELLEKISSSRLPAENSLPEEDKPVWLSTADPALPHGPGYPWQLTTPDGTQLNIVGSAMNYLGFVACQPVVYAEGFFERLTFLAAFSDAHLEALISQICNFLKLPGHLKPRNRIEILRIDGRPAASYRHANMFIRKGFETEGDGLILWPSAL